MARRRPIYVESRIRCDMDDLWAATQDPDLHQRWDLRFGSIRYQPKVEGEPQQFTYATTVLPGVTIAGTGESLGDRDRPDGTRQSALRFWAQDPRSLIESGAGYWRYVPTDDGIRFLTGYDYRPRWGRLGAVIDRTLFRPAFGWATAWSFDRLRLWLEEGIAPERSRDQAIAHATAVAGLAGVWLYQGLVPKLRHADADEVAIWRGFGLKADRSSLTRAFNPVSLNWAVAALAGIAALTGGDLPSGRRALRTPPDRQPAPGGTP